MADIRYERATRTYPGTDTPAVDALDLHIADAELMVLVGPSGSGKSTALRMLAGLEDVDDGGIWIGDRDVTYVRPRDRDVAMVFQNYALYPYLTVAQNIGFPLKMTRIKRSERDLRVREVADLLGLTDLLERKPGQLSGGQRQRVAMGRAIVRSPKAYLMDEPLSNLDAKLRVQMRADIADLQARLGVTTVYVTHDQSEAMTLGSRVAVLRDGKLQQCAPPRELYERPVNSFVAGFIGSPAMSLVEVPLGTNGSIDLAGVAIPLPGECASAATARGLARLLVGLRPEALRLSDEGIAARVEAVEVLGADAYVFCAAEIGGGETRVTARVDARDAPARGDAVRLTPQGRDAHLFDPASGERLPS
ncbi:MAG TPA: ATP-binding cassette domain-containing protein [Gaiella sp.]|nr:ATP-binding cassette domain-containing protein [Gaiella sp.]